MPKACWYATFRFGGMKEMYFSAAFSMTFFQVRDVVQYIQLIIGLKSLVFKRSIKLQSIHCIQNYAHMGSIKKKLFAL